MKKKMIWTALLMLVALILFAPACWAKSKGFCYIVGYSYAKKKAFFSPIIVQKVNSKSYSEEEFVTDVELIQELESQFQGYLASMVDLDADRYTVSARGAYKSNTIADKKYKDEIDVYETKGFTVKIIKEFVFSD